MKKLVGILMALALVLCMATTAFAADGTEGDPFTSFGPTLTIPAGETVVFQLAPSSTPVVITDANGEVSALSPYGMECGTQNPDGSYAVSLEQNCAGGCVLYFSSTATEDKTYTIGGVSIGSGTQDDPYTAFGETLTIPAGQTVYFQLTPSEEVVTITDANGEVSALSPFGMPCGTANPDGSLTVSLAQNHMSGCVLTFTSTATEDKTYTVSMAQPTPDPGTESNPFPIDALPFEGQATVVEGSEGVYYAWNITETGIVTIAASGDNWEVKLFDMYDNSPYYESDLINSVDNAGESVSVQVDAGDVLLVYVNTYAREYYPGSDSLYDVKHPAGNVDFKVTFAAIGSKEAPIKLTNYAFEMVPAGEDGLWFVLDSTDGHMLDILSNGMTVKIDGEAVAANDDGIVGMILEPGEHTVQIINSGTEDSYVEVYAYAKGSYEYPFEAQVGETVQKEPMFSFSGKYYVYTAPVDGTLTLVMDPEGDWLYNIENITGKVSCGPYTTVDDVVKATYELHVEAGDEILIYIQNGAEDSFLMADGEITFELKFKGDKPGTVGNEINVNVPADMVGVDAPAGTNMYYFISSQLNGQLLTLVGDANTTLTVNGVAVEGTNGVFVVELTGAPTNAVVITNNGDQDASYAAEINWPLGTEGNPIRVINASELTGIDVAGKGETYISVNSQLNGMILTIVGDANTTVTYGTTAVTGKDGVFTIELTGVPTNIIAVSNSGEKDVSCVATLEWPLGAEDNPINVNNAGDLTGVDVSAGGQTFIAVNGQLNGQILTIIGDANTTLNVNGTDVTGVNGVFTVELTGTPVNKIVVGNKGDKDASYVATINYPVGSQNNPININNASELSGIAVAGKGETYIAVSGQLNGQILTIIGDANTTLNVNGTAVEGVNGVFTVELTGTPVNKIVVGNKGEKAVEYVANINYPLGSESNPIVIGNASELSGIAVAGKGETYIAINGLLNGQILTIIGDDNTTVTYGTTAVEGDNGVFVIELNSAPVNMIVVGNKGEKTVEYVASINYPLGSESNPIVVGNASELTGVVVAGKGETYIAVSGQLNGQILTIIGDANTTLNVNGTAVTGVNGVFTVELTGTPVNKIVVGNKGEKDVEYVASINYPLGSESNPIVVGNAFDLNGVDVAAKGETYIAVNSQLNGQILTIIGDANTTVTVNGVAVTGDNGIFTVELTGTPVNKIVVGNKGDKAASYVASIQYPAGSESNPAVIDPLGGTQKAEAAAGSTTYYVINGTYNGNYLVVEGKGLTVTVNGTAVKATGDKYIVELTGTPVNSIVIANAGTAAVAYSVSVTADNPATGDAGILMPVVAALVSIMGAVALVIKKKEN